MSKQDQRLLTAAQLLNPDKLDGVLSGGFHSSGMAIVPGLPVPHGARDIAVNDIFDSSESAVFGYSQNLFDDNGSGADIGEGFSVTEVNGADYLVDAQFLLASGALLTVHADGTFEYDTNHVWDSLPDQDSGAANGIGVDQFTYRITGGSEATVTIYLHGRDSDDVAYGTEGNDRIFAGAGDDSITGGAGDDRLDGGSGHNAANYSGYLSDYAISYDPSERAFSIMDNRDGVPDGNDVVANVQTLHFFDATQTYTFDEAGNAIAIKTAYIGGPTLTVESDPFDVKPWLAITTTEQDTQGLQSQDILLDGGDRWLNTYGDGVNSPSLESQHFDADGNLLTDMKNWGDGTHSLTIYDVNNEHPWANVTINFDAYWNQTTIGGQPDDAPSGATAQQDVRGPGIFDDVQATLDTVSWNTTPYDPNVGAAVDLTITGGFGGDTLYGYGGNDRIDGAGGNDTITGGRGDDTLTGGAGRDHFIFHAGDGQDTITDFEVRSDLIDLRGFDITDFDQLSTHMIQIEDDTIITFERGNGITLHNVGIGMLTSDNFQFNLLDG